MPLALFRDREQNKKTILLSVVIAAATFFACALFFAHPVFAAQGDAIQNLNSVQKSSGLGTKSLGSIIGTIIHIFLGLVGGIALIICIYGGFLWMTAGGSEEKVEKAKQVLRNGVIGLALILMSFGITQFIMSKINGATQGTLAVGGAGGAGNAGDAYLKNYDGSSALGTVIDSHKPGRGELNVPRNTLISVLFKFPVDPATLIDAKSPLAKHKAIIDASGKSVDTVISGPLKEGAISIFETAAGKEASLKSSEVTVLMAGGGTDLTGFTLYLGKLLGSSQDPTPITVQLSDTIMKWNAKSVSAFKGYKPYSWKFTVGTTLDLTPPRVVSIVPVSGKTYDKNITIQITFSEPVNLASAVGEYDPTKGKSFTNITAAGKDSALVPGQWRAGSGFEVIEFTPLKECATNSCGQKIFCLPGNDAITIRARSGNIKIGNEPQEDVAGGLVGVTDMANNALDGGGENAKTQWSQNNGKAQGSDVDDFWMTFNTTDKTKTGAPQVIDIDPPAAATLIAVTSEVNITFDSLMKITSFGDAKLTAQDPRAQAGFSKNAENTTFKNASDETIDVTKMTLVHVDLAKNQPYVVFVKDTAQDIYQNCFTPATAPKNDKKNLFTCSDPNRQDNFNCCDGQAAGDSCKLLKYDKNVP